MASGAPGETSRGLGGPQRGAATLTYSIRTSLPTRLWIPSEPPHLTLQPACPHESHLQVQPLDPAASEDGRTDFGLKEGEPVKPCKGLSSFPGLHVASLCLPEPGGPSGPPSGTFHLTAVGLTSPVTPKQDSISNQSSHSRLPARHACRGQGSFWIPAPLGCLSSNQTS